MESLFFSTRQVITHFSIKLISRNQIRSTSPSHFLSVETPSMKMLLHFPAHQIRRQMLEQNEYLLFKVPGSGGDVGEVVEQTALQQ